MSGTASLGRGAGGARPRRVWLALALAAALGNGPRGDHARAHHLPMRNARGTPERFTGEYVVQVPLARAGLELALKRGFEVRFGELTRAGGACLRVARQRALSEEVAPRFVPVGPTVELSPALGSAEFSFLADHFRVRAGHRLVLAVERAPPCGPSGCWQLVEARYEGGRCRARLVGELGRRMQFGSLPAH